MYAGFTDEAVNAFQRALRALNQAELPYVIGGAFAIHHFTGRWRNTHDLDIYLEHKDVPKAIDVLESIGLRDQGELAAGDREWIYHAEGEDILMDVIWRSPNHLTEVDETFYQRGPEGVFLEVPVRFMPADELARSKLFTLNRQRSDWPDIMHLVRSCHADMDWPMLLEKLGEHWQVLLAFTVLYDWTYPAERRCIPQEIRSELLRRKIELPINTDEPMREVILDPWIYTRPGG